MKFIAVIPARYASTRFPAKPLAMLGGKPVVQHVYERVARCVSDVAVATDDERIFAAVEAFGGKAIMTSPNHRSGTDRCWEAFEEWGTQADVIINVQGDEPFIAEEQIEVLKQCFEDEHVEIATIAKPFEVEDGWAALSNPNSPKVIIDKQGRAVLFSRSVIPYLRGEEPENWLSKHQYYKHVGIYAFRRKALGEVTKLKPSPLEVAESLEQLRWLENGYKIGVGLSSISTIGIDTPEDLAAAEEYLRTYNK